LLGIGEARNAPSIARINGVLSSSVTVLNVIEVAFARQLASASSASKAVKVAGVIHVASAEQALAEVR
jgi:hypothetical protein